MGVIFSSDDSLFTSGSLTPYLRTIRSLRETANDAFLDVESLGKGFLVMSVTPHKYWRITIDGRDAAPVVTNIGYQGLTVPPGRHHIEVRATGHEPLNFDVNIQPRQTTVYQGRLVP